MKAVKGELVKRDSLPNKHVLTCKFYQDLFNCSSVRFKGKVVGVTIQLHKLKFAVKRIIIRNSIEPAKTGNYSNVEE